MAAAQIRGSAAPAKATARRWLAQPSARILRFAPLAPSTVPASLRWGAFGDLAASAAYKPLTTMCMKADYTTPVDSVTATEQTGGEIEEPAIAAPANEEISTEQEVVPQQKCAKIHDFCLGIPFGGFLFSMGLIGFLFWRSPVSLTFGVAPGLAILALGVLSLKVWRSGKSSLPFILAQAGVAAAVSWKHCQAYTQKVLPWGFYAALSAAMICFYAYVLLAGGNPPPKKARAAA
uniref:Protein FATTY ACID EXPORT 1, chloroplastic n=1 Tax=Setaria italica TaxID=4555 RepID=K3XZ44_SETIT